MHRLTGPALAPEWNIVKPNTLPHLLPRSLLPTLHFLNNLPELSLGIGPTANCRFGQYIPNTEINLQTRIRYLRITFPIFDFFPITNLILLPIIPNQGHPNCNHSLLLLTSIVID